MDTEYISFCRPNVAAVSMTRGPFFLRKFAASIRQKQISDNLVLVTYRYHFEAKPGFSRIHHGANSRFCVEA